MYVLPCRSCEQGWGGGAGGGDDSRLPHLRRFAHQLYQASRLYGAVGMHPQAVEAALDLGDLDLAKAQAAKEQDPAARKALWLRILDRSAQTDDGGKVPATPG